MAGAWRGLQIRGSFTRQQFDSVSGAAFLFPFARFSLPFFGDCFASLRELLRANPLCDGWWLSYSFCCCAYVGMYVGVRM